MTEITSISTLECMTETQLVQALLNHFDENQEYNRETLSNISRVDLIKLIKQSSEYKHQLLHNPNDNPPVYCLDKRLEIVCLLEDFQQTNCTILIPPNITKLYSLDAVETSLDEMDKLKILYQILVGSKQNNVLSLPWTALTLSQTVAITKERDPKISIIKAMVSPNPASWIASQLKKSQAFTDQFGKSEKFESCTLFGFSLEDPLNLDWGVTDDDDTRQEVKLLRHRFKKRTKALPETKITTSNQPNSNTISYNLQPSESMVVVNNSTKSIEVENGVVGGNADCKVDHQQLGHKDENISKKNNDKNASKKEHQELQKETKRLDIDLKEDLSLVPVFGLNKDLVANGKGGSNVTKCTKCTTCKLSSRSETLTCSLCHLKIHYKCYPSQLYEDSSGKKKRKKMAESTFKTIKKIKNMLWLCNDCDDINIIQHVLNITSDKLRSKMALSSCTEENTSIPITPLEEDDRNLDETVAELNKTGARESDSIPSMAISDITGSPDRTSSEGSRSTQSSILLQPITSQHDHVVDGDQMIVRTPEINVNLQVQESRCQESSYTPLTASTPGKNGETNKRKDTSIGSNSHESERGEIKATDSHHSILNSLEENLECLKTELLDFKAKETEHFQALLRCLSPEGKGSINTCDRDVEQLAGDNILIERSNVGDAGSILKSLQEISEENNNILRNLIDTADKDLVQLTSASPQTRKFLYSEKAQDGSYAGQTYSYKKLEPSLDQATTTIISGALSRKLVCNSKVILHTFNKYFKSMKVKSAFVTKGGSLMLEFSEKDDAETVRNKWDPSFFTEGKNNSKTYCSILGDLNKNTVIIKEVQADLEDNDLNIMIAKYFPGAIAKRFVTKEKVKLTTVKVEMESASEKKKIMEQGLKLEGKVYAVEEYKPRRRIIQCYNCLRFGHVAKLCGQSHPSCKHCGRNHS